MKELLEKIGLVKKDTEFIRSRLSRFADEDDYKSLQKEFTRKSQILSEIKKTVDSYNGSNSDQIIVSVKEVLKKAAKGSKP